MEYSQLNAEFRASCNNLVDNHIRCQPKVKSINNRPLTGFMVLGLALEYVDCFNRGEPPVVLNCFERVVSVESERFVEQLYEQSLQGMHNKFTFSPLVDKESPFTDL